MFDLVPIPPLIIWNSHPRGRLRLGRLAAIASFALCVGQPGISTAAEVYRNSDLSIRWDNTFKYSRGWRLEGVDPTLLADPNADDGDRNFRSGNISNRVDLLSEFNVAAGPVGFEASAAAWYDTVYRRSTDNNSAATFNSVSVRNNQLPAPTRRLHGKDAELLNAFIYGHSDLDDMPVAVRVGRSNLIWGESLFFADNGISAGQAPVDGIKALSVPSSKAKEVYMPVAQAWASLQPRPGLALEMYYQFEWRKSRLPGVGSYFAVADFIDAGGERLIVGPGQFFNRAVDQPAPASGQYGAAVRVSNDSSDFGFYVLRYNAKDPQVYLRFGPFLGQRSRSSALVDGTDDGRERAALYGVAPGAIFAGPGRSLRFDYALYGNPATGEVGTYDLAYPKGIEVYGASFSGYLGDNTIAGEISLRRHTPLLSQPLLIIPIVRANTDDSPQYAIGNSAHVQASIISVLPPSPLWDSAGFAAEIAANRRLSITRNPDIFDTTRTRNAVSVRAAIEAQYFAVLPGLDLSVPAGFGYGLSGHSSVNQSQNDRVGDISVGIRAVYRAVWEGSIMLTHFVGPPSRQPYADRDFISISIQRTF